MATFIGHGAKIYIGGRLLATCGRVIVTTTEQPKPPPKRFEFAGNWDGYLGWLRALTRLPLAPVGRN